MGAYHCPRCLKPYKQKPSYDKHIQEQNCQNIVEECRNSFKKSLMSGIDDKLKTFPDEFQEEFKSLMTSMIEDIKCEPIIHPEPTIVPWHDTLEYYQKSWPDRATTPRKTDVGKEFNFMEVCSGGGGLSCGLIRSGLNAILLNDIDKNSCKTLKKNHPHTEILEGSFTDIDYKKYIGKCDVLCGGVPCQSFSYAGKKGGLDDKRGSLIIRFSEMVNIIQPKIFMIENVKGLLTHNKGETIKHVINQGLLDMYTIKYELIKCVKHGIPQKRERVVIVGIQKKYNYNFKFPEANDKVVTIKDALKNVPKSDGAWYPESKIKYFKKIPPGGCWINLPIEEQKDYLGKGFYSGGGKRGLLRKLKWDEPCLTILCSPAQKNTERCHPDEDRPLTIRESARIQTFDDNYEFSGSVSSQYSQIGNAVPVKLGELLGKELIRSLSSLSLD